VAGVEQWIQPFEASHAWARTSGDPRFDRGEPRLETVDQTLGLAVAPKGRTDPPDVFEHPVDARRIQ